MDAEYTASNCASYDLRSAHLDSENIPLPKGVDVTSFDFQIYWQPHCGAFTWAGVADLGGTKSLMNMPDFSTVDGSAAVLAHELGHNFGARHASCIADENRGAVAWCDSDVTMTKTSGDCKDVGAAWTEYCSPHSIMGESSDGSTDWLTR